MTLDRLLRWLIGGVAAAMGLAMAAGGIWLVLLGGSFYYAAAGLAILVAGSLIAAGHAYGRWLLLATFAATVAWAVWEVGFDPWRLMPHVLAFGVFVIVAVLPWIWRRLPEPSTKRGYLAALALVLLPIAVIAGAQGFRSQPLLGVAPSATGPVTDAGIPGDWGSYGRTPGGTKYAPLDQITPDNVGRLAVAWTYRTGEGPTSESPKKYRFETTPLKIGDTLYFCTPHNVVVALDADTGAPRWRVDPQVAENASVTNTCRGVSYWASVDVDAPCARRIFTATQDARLIALDATSGARCPGFGTDGFVNLTVGMGEVKRGYYYVTSAPTVTRRLVIVGGWVRDGQSTDEPSGVVRAFDAVTGALVWNWDAGRPDDTAPLAPGATYSRSSPNSWAPASVDETLGMVYLPMGNQTPDMWGGHRSGPAELYSSSVVALDLASGKVRWVYQTVHHDIWDLDVPAQPLLVDVRRGDAVVPALYLMTKRGDIFVLDRRDGRLIVPAPEKPVPQGAAEGDRVSPTQPFSDLSFAPAAMRESDMWGLMPLDALWCRIAFRQSHYEGMFTPPSLKATIAYPGSYGVFNWGGAAADQGRQILVVNASYTAWRSRLIPRDKAQEEGANVPQDGTPFAVQSGPWISPLGNPCQAPPWGELIGLDLSTNAVVWRRTFGTTGDIIPVDWTIGTPSMGGPLATASGLIFIGASMDNNLHALDIHTGEELWRGRIPAGGQATPMTYMSEAGRQIVVIAAGGHGALGTDTGDYLVAFALPN